MSSIPTPQGRNAAVNVVGVCTILWGGWHIVLGVWTILIAIGWFAKADTEPWWPVLMLFGLLPLIAIVIGLGFVLYGLLGLFAGSGVIRRKRWARTATFFIASLAVLFGLMSVNVSSDQGMSGLDVAVTAIQVAYGILALVVLARNGSEFRRDAKREPIAGAESA